MMLQDTGQPFVASLQVNGTSYIYDLPVESISDVAFPPTVTLGTTVLSNQATSSYTLDAKYGVISFVSPPGPAGTPLVIQGFTYDFWLDEEVSQAVTDAFNLHVADQDPLPVIDPVSGQASITTTEEYLVSIMAARELLWFRTTDASQQIDIHTPEGVSIPRSERWKQMLQQISALENEYKELSLALGVGTFRIQIVNQRRVSYTTNRLVPIFRDQEYNTPYSGFYPTAAAVGSIITIWGKYFTGTTSVTFGGVPSTNFTVVSDCEITAYVPAGAVTGQIGIVTPYGMVLSTAQFVVGQPAPFLDYGPELVDVPVPPGV
jgi:hypothetical protein